MSFAALRINILRPSLVLFFALLFCVRLSAQVSTNLPPVPEILASNVTRIALVEHFALIESSGLAASPRYRNVFWSHNDTEDPTFLFAMNVKGEHIGAYEVQDAGLIDWEAIAFDEFGSLYLADTGSDGMVRSRSAVHRVAEPDISKSWGPARVERTWYVAFPGEREDCEAMFIHEGFAYLISKFATNNIVNYYRFSLSGDEFVQAEKIGTLSVSDNVSDASLSQDKQRLALLTSDGVEILFINGNPLNAATAPRRSTRYENGFMEGAAFVGTSVLVTTEQSTNSAASELILFNDPDLSGAPRIVTGLSNRTAFVGGSMTFEIEVEGVPPLTFTWRFNGEVIPGATNDTLVLTNLALANAGSYEVTVSNFAGVVSSSGTLTVNERVIDLRVTEIMSSESPGILREDWWELTSYSTEPIDLFGWRFNDSTGDLTDAFVIPDHILIRPNESIVFVENLTADEFRSWWGTNNVPPEVQIVTYDPDTPMSFNAVRDQLRVWDATTTDSGATFLQVDIGAATAGVSFTRDPVSGALVNSVLGVNGAFRAVDGGDIGSPGFHPTNSGVRLEGALRGPALQLMFPVEPTKTYAIEQSDTLFPGNWRPVIEGVQGPGTGDILFQRSLAVTNRFFRLRVEERP